MTGHGGDVKSCDWHPTKAVLASGSKDGLVKVWDAKAGRNIATLHGHRNTVMETQWNANDNWLLSACRDQSLKVRKPPADIKDSAQRGTVKHSRSCPNRFQDQSLRVPKGHTYRQWKICPYRHWKTLEKLPKQMSENMYEVFQNRHQKQCSGC